MNLLNMVMNCWQHHASMSLVHRPGNVYCHSWFLAGKLNFENDNLISLVSCLSDYQMKKMLTLQHWIANMATLPWFDKLEHWRTLGLWYSTSMNRAVQCWFSNVRSKSARKGEIKPPLGITEKTSTSITQFWYIYDKLTVGWNGYPCRNADTPGGAGRYHPALAPFNRHSFRNDQKYLALFSIFQLLYVEYFFSSKAIVCV